LKSNYNIEKIIPARGAPKECWAALQNIS